MEKITLYEYNVVNKKFVKLIHEAKLTSSGFRFTKNNNQRIVYKEDLDIAKRNTVFSLDDNEEAAKELLICSLQRNIAKKEKELLYDKNLLDVLIGDN